MPKIVLHELRHTFASLSNYVGVQEFNIGKAMLTINNQENIYAFMLLKKNRKIKKLWKRIIKTIIILVEIATIAIFLINTISYV